MRLGEETRECVVFLGHHHAGDDVENATIKPRGTGFFMTRGADVYLVTAKHVADNIGRPFLIRTNRKQGGAGTIPIDAPEDLEWCFHEDAAVDLAVAPLLPPSWVVAKGVKVEGVAAFVGSGEPPQTGDQIAVVGLFHLLYGEKQNLPIVHSGHIAMMPGAELIPVGAGKSVGYLVQANAISGCSGSPVFVARQRIMTLGGEKFLTGYETSAHLLGVWSSSWKVKDAAVVAADADLDGGLLAPLGMGIVTPAEKLLEILDSEQLKKAEAASRERRLAKRREIMEKIMASTL